MDLKKVLVFDNHRYFFRFLKYDFKKINFTIGEKQDVLFGIKGEYSTVIFVIYSEDDLVDLFRVYTNGINLLVCNHSMRMVDKLENIKNLAIVDCLEIKKNFRRDIQEYFDQLVFNEE
jgi:hypothetical protein